jgi:hypothetical protein
MMPWWPVELRLGGQPPARPAEEGDGALEQARTLALGRPWALGVAGGLVSPDACSGGRFEEAAAALLAKRLDQWRAPRSTTAPWPGSLAVGERITPRAGSLAGATETA